MLHQGVPLPVIAGRPLGDQGQSAALKFGTDFVVGNFLSAFLRAIDVRHQPEGGGSFPAKPRRFFASFFVGGIHGVYDLLTPFNKFRNS
jgi:hypothetical protein